MWFVFIVTFLLSGLRFVWVCLILLVASVYIILLTVVVSCVICSSLCYDDMCFVYLVLVICFSICKQKKKNTEEQNDSQVDCFLFSIVVVVSWCCLWATKRIFLSTLCYCLRRESNKNSAMEILKITVDRREFNCSLSRLSSEFSWQSKVFSQALTLTNRLDFILCRHDFPWDDDEIINVRRESVALFVSIDLTSISTPCLTHERHLTSVATRKKC